MSDQTRAIGVTLTYLLTAALFGCAARVVNLDSARGVPTSVNHARYALSVQIDRFTGAADKAIDPSRDWDGELATILRETGAFSAVIHPRTDRYGADLTIRGVVHPPDMAEFVNALDQAELTTSSLLAR